MWIPWVCLLEAVVTVTGNVTVLVIFTRTPSLRKRKYCLLVSLAVSDLLVGLISVPMYVILNLYDRWWLYEILLYGYNVQDVLFGTTSTFGLAAVAIERAYAVYFPFKHRTLWNGTYVIGVAVIWVLALCGALFPFYSDWDWLVLLCTLVVPIIMSLVIVITSYTLIWVKMHCITRIPNHAICERDKKLTVTLLIVTVISLVAWIPFQVVNVYEIVCDGWCLANHHTLVEITKFLQYSNSLVNPIIYALRMPLIRKALVKRLECCTRRRTAQVPNERRKPYQPNVIPLSIYDNRGQQEDANNEFDVNTHGVRSGIQINDDNRAYTNAEDDINTLGIEVKENTPTNKETENDDEQDTRL